MTLPRKGVAAAVVLLVGLTAAWLFFRRGAAPDEPGASPERLVIKEPVASPWTKPTTDTTVPWQKNAPSPPASTDEPQAHLEAPQPVAAANPWTKEGTVAKDATVTKDAAVDMAARFAEALGSTAPPGDAVRAFSASRDSGPAAMVARAPLDSAGAAARVHRIIDGDTLGSLAQKYLGSSQRQNEIFEANRDKLRDPELLPIGVDLKIPSDPPLAPVPAGALRN